MPVLYLRVSSEIYDYVKATGDDAGVSMAKAAEALLAEARRLRWTVRPAEVHVDAKLPIRAED